jgi:hypothetical protein
MSKFFVPVFASLCINISPKYFHPSQRPEHSDSEPTSFRDMHVSLENLLSILLTISNVCISTATDDIINKLKELKGVNVTVIDDD